MIIVASSSKPFVFTPKGAPKRAAILNAYAEEIDATYANVEMGVQTKLPSEWSAASSLKFARAVVGSVLRSVLDKYEDIFSKGCDR